MIIYLSSVDRLKYLQKQQILDNNHHFAKYITDSSDICSKKKTLIATIFF